MQVMQKRKRSLMASVENCLSRMMLLEMRLEELLENLSDVQRKITEMKMYGYNNKEIYLILEIKPSTYYKELQRINPVLEKMVS